MRTITFNVNQQKIKPTNSVSHIYPGTDNYLRLEFAFDTSWEGCMKAIGFTYRDSDNEYALLLDKNNSCTVPAEAFDGDRLTFYLVGKNRKKYRIQSQSYSIRIGE